MKCLPSERTGDSVCVGDEATAYYEIERRMQFKKEEFACVQGFERCGPRRPKVDLRKSRLGSEKFKPIPIGHSDKQPNNHCVGAPLSHGVGTVLFHVDLDVMQRISRFAVAKRSSHSCLFTGFVTVTTIRFQSSSSLARFNTSIVYRRSNKQVHSVPLASTTGNGGMPKSRPARRPVLTAAIQPAARASIRAQTKIKVLSF
jgi:hypothetical protein